MDDMNEILKAVIETEIDDEDELIEKHLSELIKKQKLSDKAMNAAKGMMRLANAFKDEPGMKAVMDKLAGMAGYPAPTRGAREEEEEMRKATLAEEEKRKKSRHNEDDKPAPKKGAVSKSDLPEEFQAILKAQDDRIAEERTARERIEKQLETERRERVRKDLFQKCETDFCHGPGMSSDAMADMLMKAYDASNELGQALEKQWAETSKVVKQSNLLTAQGNGVGTGANSASAWGQIQARARDLVQKSLDTDLTAAKALDMVLKTDEGKRLYDQYLEENPAQRARAY